jgi:hypothetical protein
MKVYITNEATLSNLRFTNYIVFQESTWPCGITIYPPVSSDIKLSKMTFNKVKIVNSESKS